MVRSQLAGRTIFSMGWMEDDPSVIWSLVAGASRGSMSTSVIDLFDYRRRVIYDRRL
jgi:hypothetical protein